MLADGVDLHDVRMVDPGDGLGLGLETLEGGVVGGEVVVEELECDVALERELPGEVHLPHAAAAEPAEHLEIAQRAAGEVDRRFGGRVGHLIILA